MSSRKWLMKTEPNTYSIDDLKADKITHWEGIRNYQARNFMKNDMEIGDSIFIYHSNVTPPGIVGLAEVCSKPYPDFFAWDQSSQYFDSKSTKENPRWFMVDVAFKCKFKSMLSLNQIKQDSNLSSMMVIKKGMRLSIQPISNKEFDYIMKEYQ